MKLTSCAISDIGLSRNNNEDSYFNDTEKALFVVADGMGGHAAGDVASRVAVESVIASLCKAGKELPLDRLRAAIEQANKAVAHEAQENTAWKGMGTTLTILLIEHNQGFLAHVGDSRLYLSRATDFKQLSEDHSLLEAQIRLGVRSKEQISYSNLGHILLQAVGITPELDIDLKQFTLAPGDCLLLCSDGLTNMVNDAGIKSTIQQTTSVDKRCSDLIDQALAAGGKDNITVLLVQIDEPDQELSVNNK